MRPGLVERPARLAEGLAALPRRRLWGREAELALFRAALARRSAPFSVFYIHGLGGIGKSALLAECAREARRSGLLTVCLDARHAEPSPRGFLVLLGEALGLPETDSPLDRLSREPAVALTVDSCDSLAPLDSWLRGTFLPQLPGRGVLMMAGRQPPPVDWTVDPALGGIFRALPLRNLRPEESRSLLSGRGVPAEQHAAVLEFTHGHPLALVLLAEVVASAASGTVFRPESTPNVVRELLSRLVASVPTPRHRRALEACAHARVTTEALLAAVIEDGDPHELFEWLRGLSFIEQGTEGVLPHDVVREILDADFRWRDPDGYHELHRRIWRHLGQKVAVTTGRARQRVFFDKAYLHRGSGVGGRYHDYSSLGTVYGQVATEHDRAGILETVRRHEGEASAEIAARWLQRQPQAFQVARGPGDELLGLVASLTLREESPDEAAADPALIGAWAFARGGGRLRPGEVMVHHRFHMSPDRYQQISPNINLLAMRVTLAPVEQRGLAWSLVAFAEPEFWLPLTRYINFQRAEEADFTVGGRSYGVFVHDWRSEPFEVWWDQLRERSLPGEPAAEEAPSDPPPSVVVLSEPEFSLCVRQALKNYTRTGALAENPLLLSRLVTASGAGGPARLQALLREALDALNASPREGKFHRALLYTYFEPATTQERAAERLGLPFSTYRYHLARGTERIVEWLWRLELARPVP